MAIASSMSEVGMLAQAHGPGNAGDEGILVAGEFRLHLGARRVTVQGRELQLSNEEFEMLVFLIGRPKSVVNPQTRLTGRAGGRLVWKADFLRVLGQLREKLASVEGCSHCIRTEPWVVYHFDPHSRDEVH
ncbi:MAG TPA: hypothetical protein VEF05_16375 [Terriglobales bacterium]|nr:hypothetical protein [Terriglobales bacterium]